MAKYCRYCGKPVGENAKFCRSCGKQLVKSADAAAPSEPPAKGRTDHPVKTAAPVISNVPAMPIRPVIKKLSSSAAASAFSGTGEMLLGGFGDELTAAVTRVTNVLSPGKAIFETVRSFLGGSLGMILKPKTWIPALLMAGIWFALGLLKDSDSQAIRTISRLLYAEGGMETDPFAMAGGLLGKGTVAAALASLFTGGIGSALKGIGSLFRTKGEKRSLLLTLFGMVIGAAFYYFFGGMRIPSAETACVGIAGALLSLETLGNRSGVFYRLIQSFTAKTKNGVRSAANGRCDSLLTGLTLGFSLAAAAAASGLLEAWL